MNTSRPRQINRHIERRISTYELKQKGRRRRRRGRRRDSSLHREKTGQPPLSRSASLSCIYLSLYLSIEPLRFSAYHQYYHCYYQPSFLSIILCRLSHLSLLSDCLGLRAILRWSQDLYLYVYWQQRDDLRELAKTGMTQKEKKKLHAPHRLYLFIQDRERWVRRKKKEAGGGRLHLSTRQTTDKQTLAYLTYKHTPHHIYSAVYWQRD